MRSSRHLNMFFVVPQQLIPDTACLSLIWHTCVWLKNYSWCNLATWWSTTLFFWVKPSHAAFIIFLGSFLFESEGIYGSDVTSHFRQVIFNSYPIIRIRSNTFCFGTLSLVLHHPSFMTLKCLPEENKNNRHTRGDALTSHLLQYHIWAPYQSGFRGKIMATITRSTTK